MLGVGRLGEKICQVGCGVLTYCCKDLSSEASISKAQICINQLNADIWTENANSSICRESCNCHITRILMISAPGHSLPTGRPEEETDSNQNTC